MVLNSWGTHKYRARKDYYYVTRCQINITQLFKADYNHEKSGVMIVPKTINARTWIENYNLTIFCKQELIHQSLRKEGLSQKNTNDFTISFLTIKAIEKGR